MAVVAAASLGTAFADSCANSFSGFYAGLQAGMNSTAGTYSIDNYQSRNAATAGQLSSTNGTLGKRSFLGGIFTGYGMGVGSCAYAGAEVYANFGNSSATIYDTSNLFANDKNLKLSVKRDYNLGAKLRLGYTVSPQAMIFLGLGLEYAKMQLQSDNVQTATAQIGVTTTVKKNSRKISFAPSIGMDMFVNKNIFLRGEYTYVLGTSQKLEATQVGVIRTNATVKANMTQQRFALGLGYKF